MIGAMIGAVGARTSALTVLLTLAAGCGVNQGVEQPSTTMVRGDRQRSRALKAAQSRPHPWTREHGVFDADRFDLQPYIARRRAAHREAHSEQLLVLERFSHPACGGLSQRDRRGCPLLDTRWRRRDVTGGVTLVAPEQAVAAATLQRRVQCHVAFGRVHGSRGCPLHLPGVRVSTTQRRGEVQLTIVTADPTAVGPLRERVKELVP